MLLSSHVFGYRLYATAVLRQQLNTLRKEPTETIPQYVARAKTIASELEAVGHKPEASEVALPVLQGLPKEYTVLSVLQSSLLHLMNFYAADNRAASQPGGRACSANVLS